MSYEHQHHRAGGVKPLLVLAAIAGAWVCSGVYSQKNRSELAIEKCMGETRFSSLFPRYVLANPRDSLYVDIQSTGIAVLTYPLGPHLDLPQKNASDTPIDRTEVASYFVDVHTKKGLGASSGYIDNWQQRHTERQEYHQRQFISSPQLSLTNKKYLMKFGQCVARVLPTL